jgi:DNA processing protein
MNISLSPNTQAVLLLTAPLIAGSEDASSELLTAGEYKRLARLLIQRNRQPADLLNPDQDEFSNEWKTIIDVDRFEHLLARGFQLDQAVERWQARAIWVVGQTDEAYPKRIKERLKESAPPIIYGCGDAAILDTGGLAVVGSRDVDSWLIEYTGAIGRITAGAKQNLVSGGARGIDQAAMRGALEAGGTAVGILADSLERAALYREHRELLMDGKLVLISPYDPLAGFNIGHAMQRNKLIYALADAALVVNSDHGKGGTWAGAIEQLEKLHFVPLYVRTEGDTGPGLEALRLKGALPWPNPTNPEDFVETLTVRTIGSGDSSKSEQLSLLET